MPPFLAPSGFLHIYDLWEKSNIYCKEFPFIYEFCAQRLTATGLPRRLWEELGGTEFDHRRQNHILKRILHAIRLYSRGQPLFFSVLAANITLPFRLSVLLEEGKRRWNRTKAPSPVGGSWEDTVHLTLLALLSHFLNPHK